MRILEALAKVFPTPVIPLGDLVTLEASSLPWGTTAIVVTAVVDEPLRAGLLALREAGHTAVLVMIGRRDDDTVPGVQMFRISEEVAWNAMDEIRLV
jgi:hypothetical protein